MSSLLPNVDVTVLDGGLGLASSARKGVAGAIGLASQGPTDARMITSADQAVELYGSGPLVQYVAHALESGALAMVACRVPVVGVVSDPERESRGGLVGDPVPAQGNTSPAVVLGGWSGLLAAGALEVKIASGGELGVATVVASLDGGPWSDPVATADEVVVPLAGDASVRLWFDTGTYVQDDSWAIAIYFGGTAGLTASGDPGADAQVVIEVLSTGELNEATYRLSVDGEVVTAEATIPANGTIVVTGLCTLQFTAGLTEPSFIEGDVWSVECLAGGMDIEGIAAAALRIRQARLSVEAILVTQATTAAHWAALDMLAETEFAAKGLYMHFLCFAELPENDGEDDADWATGLVDLPALAGTLRRVSVFAGWLDDVDDQVSGAGRYLGHLLGLDKISYSPGRVMSGSVRGVTVFGPDDDGIIAQLDAVGYTTFRGISGLNGVYVTNGRMLVDDTSDFRWVEWRRVMDKACREVRLAALRYLHFGMSDEGQRALQVQCQAALNRMVAAGECAAGAVEIPEGQDIIGTSTVRVKVRVQPIPTARWIEVDIAFAAQV